MPERKFLLLQELRLTRLVVYFRPLKLYRWLRIMDEHGVIILVVS